MTSFKPDAGAQVDIRLEMLEDLVAIRTVDSSGRVVIRLHWIRQAMDLATNARNHKRIQESTELSRRPPVKKATRGTRTPDLCFTKASLYQLS